MNPHLYEEKPLEIKAEADPADIRHGRLVAGNITSAGTMAGQIAFADRFPMLPPRGAEPSRVFNAQRSHHR
jgi:hypothetical protein